MILDLSSLVFIAFFGGLLSIASPCGGLLIPIYFAHTFKTKDKFLINSLIFFIGSYIAAFLVVIGFYYIFASFPYSNILFKFLGLIFILIGVLNLFGKSITIPVPQINAHNSYLSSFLLGVFAAFSQGSCFGPILGLIATNVARLNNIYLALLIMFFYTLGISLPFVLASFGLDKINLLKRIFVKGKEFKFTLFTITKTFHSSNILSFIFFVLSGIVLLFFNGSLTSVLSYTKIDLNFMLQYQDNLIKLFYK